MAVGLAGGEELGVLRAAGEFEVVASGADEGDDDFVEGGEVVDL